MVEGSMKAIIRCGDSKTKFMAPLAFEELLNELSAYRNMQEG